MNEIEFSVIGHDAHDIECRAAGIATGFYGEDAIIDLSWTARQIEGTEWWRADVTAWTRETTDGIGNVRERK